MASKKPYDSRAEAAPGQPRAAHFHDGVHQVTVAAARKVHNGMNDHPDIPRFGADDMMSGDPDRRYDPGAWDGPSTHDQVMSKYGY